MFVMMSRKVAIVEKTFKVPLSKYECEKEGFIWNDRVGCIVKIRKIGDEIFIIGGGSDA